MAGDNQVFRLSYVFDGERFTEPLNQATANTLRQLASVENANVRLTNVTIESAQKQASAVTQGAAAVGAAATAQANAINKVADATKVFTPATERIVTFSSRLQSLPTLARNLGDPFVNEVNKAKIAVDSADAQLKKFQGDAQKTAEIVVIYTNAVNALAKAQSDLATSKTLGANVLPFPKTSTRETVDVQDSLREAIESFKTSQSAALISRAPLPTEPTQITSAFNVLRDISDVNSPINPNSIQDARALAKEIASLTSIENALNQSARNLLDVLDPLSAAQRRYSMEVATANKLAATFRITTDQQNEAIRQAKFTFEETAASIRREAQSTYDTLTASNERYRAALMSGRVASAPAFVPPQATSTATLSGQLQSDIIAGRRTDPATMQAAKELADQNNRLAVEEEKANVAAQKLRDTLDPVSKIQRDLSTTLMSYLDGLGRGKIELDEYRIAQTRAKDEASRRIDDATGQTAINNATQKYREVLNPTIPLARALNDEIATINTTSLSTSEKVTLLTRAYTQFKDSVSNLPDARNQAAMADAAQRLRDTINPLAAAFRKYGEAVAEADKYVADGLLTSTERDQAVRLAESTFKAATSSIRKEAQDTYAALKAASDVFQRSQEAGRVVAGPVAPTPQITSSIAVGNQIQSDITVSGRTDPAKLQEARDLTDEFKRMTVAQEESAAAAQKLKDELDPIGAIQRNLNEKLATYRDMLDQGRISRDQLTQAERNANTTAQIKMSDVSGTSKAQDDFEKLSKSADAYKAKLNPLITAQKLYGNEIARVKELVSVQELTEKEANAILGNSEQQYNKITAALKKANAEQLSEQQIRRQNKPLLQQTAKDYSEFSSSVTRSFGLSRIGFLELQAAGINTFQSLAAGISPLRTAETEGAQAVGAVIQGTNLTLKQLVTYAVPIAAVTAAFIAFGAAVAGAASRATELRQLTVALDTFHTGTITTARDLQNIEREFARTGESAATLKTLIAELARNPNINIGATKDILNVSRDLGAALGTDIAGGAKELTTALDGGAQGIVNLGLRLKAFDGEQAGEILNLNRTVGAQAAVARGYDLIRQHLLPYTDSLSPVQKLTREITGLWNTFIQSIEDSEPVQNALNYINDLTKKITSLKDSLKKENETGVPNEESSIFSGILHGAVIGGATGVGVGAALGAPGVVTVPVGAALGGAIGTVGGGVLGGFGAVGLNKIGPLGPQAGVRQPIPVEIIGSTPSTLPAIATYGVGNNTLPIALPSGVSNSTAQILAEHSNESQIVSLGNGLRNVNENISRYNTQLTTTLTEQERTIQNDQTETKTFDAMYLSLQHLVTSIDTAATSISNVKMPATIGNMSVGGAVGGATATGAGQAFFNALAMAETGGRDITQQISDANSRKGTPGQGIFQMIDPTFQRYAPLAGYGQYKSALGLPREVQQAVAAQVPFNQFGQRTQRILQQQFGPLDTSKTIGQLAGAVGGGLGVSTNIPTPKLVTESAGTTAANVLPTPARSEAEEQAIAAANLELEKSKALLAALTPDYRNFGSQLEATIARETKRIEVLRDTHVVTLAESAAQQAYKEVIVRSTAEQQKQVETETLTSKTGIDTAKAYGTDLVSGLRAAGLAAATLANQQEPLVNIQQRTNLEVQKTADTAVLAERQQIAATTPVLARQEALASAAIKGAQAEHEQALQNQAQAETFVAVSEAQSAYIQAQISGTDADKQRTKAVLELAQSEQQEALVQARRADIATQRTDLGHTLVQNKNQAELLALQASLQGQTTEEITKQSALLTTQQQIRDRSNQISGKEKQTLIDSVTKVQDFNIALAQMQRLQERIGQLFSNIGETISSTLGTAIDDAFSGQKIQDWGTQLKQIIAQVMAQIVQFAFIRPVIGSALQALGQSQVAQSFGTIGNLVGAAGTAGAVATGAGVAGASIVDSNGSVIGTIGNAGTTAAGAGVLAGGSIFGAGGFTNFLNNLGGRLGFATTQPGLTVDELRELGVNTTTGTAATTTPGSIFGTTSLGQFLTGAGIGSAGGILLNSILGGNKLTGSVGSVGGSLAGAGIGSLLAPGIGTVIGGIVGGLGGGGIGGLFGNSRPSNAASGSSINLSTGVVSGLQSGGNAQNDQNVNQITSSISQFTRSVQELTKGTVSGAINVQAGTRDGIIASFSGPSGTFQTKAKDATTAINEIELQIAKGLTGVSDTLKMVLTKVTDPAQIQDAVTFVATYDDLKKASDSAFSSISTDIKTVGPFAQALTSLNDTFAALTDKANQFGLSLAPINAGLAEATKRLRNDFGVALSQAINTATPDVGGNRDFLNQLTGVAQGFSTNVQEQQAIGLGGDTTTTTKINQLEQLQAQAILINLTTDQLNQVTTAFQTTNPEIAAMSQALINAGISANSVTNSLTDTSTALTSFADGLKSIRDALTSLRTGPLAGLSPQEQVTQARTAFQAQATTIQSAGTATGNQLAQLSTLAQNAVQVTQNIYGNAPQTADIRTQIIAELSSILSTVKETTSSTTTDTGVNPAIAGSANVATAQSAGIVAALHAAGVPGFATGTDLAISTTTVAMPSMASTAMGNTVTNATTNTSTPSIAIPGFAKGTDFIGSIVGDTSSNSTAMTNRSNDIANLTNTSMNIANNDTRYVSTSTNDTDAKSINNNDRRLFSDDHNHFAIDRTTINNSTRSVLGGNNIGSTISSLNTNHFASGTSSVSKFANDNRSMSFVGGTVGNTAENIIVNNSKMMTSNSGASSSTSMITNNNNRKTTPPGLIIVGEKGPEYMMSRGGNWTQVGRNGPEVINQPGGAIILPNPMTPHGRSFAEGTIGARDIAGEVPGIASAISESQGGGSLLDIVGNASGISQDILSSLGDILPIAGPILGGLLGVVTGGNVVSSGIGAAASIAGFLAGGPIGGVLGGLVGLLGNLFGPKPSNNASGDLVNLSSGTISGFQSAGDRKADQIVKEISASISSVSTTLQKATGGNIGGDINVQDGRRDGIKTSYSGPLGKIDEKWGDAKTAVGQFTLAIAHNLNGIDPNLHAQLNGINDPNAIIPAIEQFTGTTIDLITGTVVKKPSIAQETQTTTMKEVAAPPPSPVYTPPIHTAPILNTPQGTALYNIIESSGASYVGDLSPENLSWWQQQPGSTVTPFTGSFPTPRNGTTAYQIVEENINGPSYVGNLTPTEVTNWTNQGATVTPLYNISKPGGISYVASLTSKNLAWWQQNVAPGVNVSPFAGLPTTENGPLYQISQQGGGPSYIGALKAADVQWWQNAGATVTSYTIPTPATQSGGTTSVVAQAARGSAYTPPGKILVGEKGPEYMMLHSNVGDNDNVRSFATGTGIGVGTVGRVDVGFGAADRIDMGNSARTVDRKGWQLVGVHGPEVINQPGGATILPFPKTPWEGAGRAFAEGTTWEGMSWEGMGRAFADGTTKSLPRTTFAPYTTPPAQPSEENSMARANKALLDGIASLGKEVVALRRVTQGGQQDTSDKLSTANRHLGDVNRKTSPQTPSPRRQKFG